MMTEVKILNALKNKNVVNLLETYKHGTTFYLVYEYLEKDLFKMLLSKDKSKTEGLPKEIVRNFMY